MPEINAAPRIDGLNDYSNSCKIMVCKNCGTKVWVNKQFPSSGSVLCMECAEELASGGISEWRFPYDPKFGQLYDTVSGKKPVDRQKSLKKKKPWWKLKS